MMVRRQDGGGTADPAELARLSAGAEEWWDPEGPFAALHRLNPARIGYVHDRLCRQFGRDPASLAPLTGLEVLDAGCGGGLLSEPLARMGAKVTAIDAAAANIGSARTHAEAHGIEIGFRQATIEELCSEEARFDAVLAMEVIEHVADVDLFVDGCSLTARNGGVVILSTLNRTARGFLLGVVAAEHILRWLPRGSHDWNRFVRPSELARGLRRNGLAVTDISGLSYDLSESEWRISADVSVNYLITAVKR